MTARKASSVAMASTSRLALDVAVLDGVADDGPGVVGAGDGRTAADPQAPTTRDAAATMTTIRSLARVSRGACGIERFSEGRRAGRRGPERQPIKRSGRPKAALFIFRSCRRWPKVRWVG